MENQPSAAQQSTITKSTMLLSPAPEPCPEPRRPARLRDGFLESPTSLCPHESHPARYGRVCAKWYRPPAVRRTAIGALAARPPKYTGNCCRSLQSTSYGDSPLIPKSTFNNIRTCHSLSGEIEPSTYYSIVASYRFLVVRGYHCPLSVMIPRNANRLNLPEEKRNRECGECEREYLPDDNDPPKPGCLSPHPSAAGLNGTDAPRAQWPPNLPRTPAGHR